MNKYLMSVSAVALVCSANFASAADPATAAAHLKAYTAAGESIVAMANTKKIDIEALDKKVDGMVVDSMWIAEEYLKLKPEAAKWFHAVFENIPNIKKLPFEEIEKNWHDGHHFDGKEKEIGIDHQAEKNEHFRDPLDSVTHPLMVQKLAHDYVAKKDEEILKKMKEEMTEGLDQVKKAVAVISKK